MIELTSFPEGSAAAVVGASGGIGLALTEALTQQPAFTTIYGFTRQPPAAPLERVTYAPLDLEDEASIAQAAERLDGRTLNLVIVATGLLHNQTLRPERALRDLDPAALAKSFAVNAIGPALLAKHLTKTLDRRQKSVFAALSARVGSIGDNRLGGWYAYRASKAALNMLIKTASVELARRHPHTAIVGLHPGTVDTALSAPFQRSVPAARLFSTSFAAERLLAVIDGLTPRDSGRHFAWDGAEIAP